MTDDKHCKYESVLLVHGHGDRNRALEICRILHQKHAPGVQLTDQELRPAVDPTVVVVWILGSDWERWQDPVERREFLNWFGRSPIHVVQLPEAEGSEPREWGVPGVVVVLPKEPIEENDLAPLLEVLAGYEWTRERVVR